MSEMNTQPFPDQAQSVIAASAYPAPSTPELMTDEQIESAFESAMREGKLDWRGKRKYDPEQHAYTIPLLTPDHYQMARVIESKLREMLEQTKTDKKVCKSCEGMGFTDGTGDACLPCNGEGVSPQVYGWVRMNGQFNNGVFHLGSTCPPGWVGAAEPVTLLVSPGPAASRQPEMWRVRLPDWVYPGGWNQMPRIPSQQAEFEYWRSQDGAVIEYAVVIQDMTSAHPLLPQADAHKTQGLILDGGRDKLTALPIPDPRTFGDTGSPMSKGAAQPQAGVPVVPLVDGSWYWVRYEGLGQTYEAPALYKDDAKAFYSFDFSGIPRLEVEVLCTCFPMTDVLKAAQRVLEWTEASHRPPIRPQLEGGQMVRVRLHALADLHDALAAHNITRKAV